MSSVLPLASGISNGRLPSAGGVADKNSSGAAFAVKPASAPQDANPDASQPSQPVVVAVNADETPPSPLVTYSAAAILADQSARAAVANATAAAETAAPLLASDDVVAPSQAAYAYAQMMQAWLESRTPRPAPALRATKSKTSAKR
jgi:hypothetical protein